MVRTRKARPSKSEIDEASAFVLDRYREFRASKGVAAPSDLSGSCRHSAIFAAALFGGEVRGNFLHAWCELPDGSILDLNERADDVTGMLEGRSPHELWGVTDPEEIECLRDRVPVTPDVLYDHDPDLARNSFERAEMAAARRVVNRWLNAWRERGIATNTRPGTEPDVPDALDAVPGYR